jgi:hypothetical protein
VGLLSLVGYTAYGQEIKDNIYEDQVIICVSGHVVEKSGNICKVYNVDDIGLNESVTTELYNNFENIDSFDMSVVD